MTYHFRIEGRVKPYVRMTRRSKHVNPQAIEYISSQEVLKLALKNQMVEHGWEMLPGQTPLTVSIWITPPSHRRDIDNEAKAILDAMNELVYPDDRRVDGLFVSRCLGEPNGIDIHVSVR